MRIFIHNVDTYLGRVLVNELRRADGGSHRVFGTVAGSAGDAPKVVKRVVGREDPKRSKKMAETLQSCKVVVLDLFNCTLEDLHFAIRALKVDPTANPPKPTGELENEATFVLMSSALVWAATPEAAGGGGLSGADYADRCPVPGSRYEQWKEMEDLAMACFNREGSTVKCLVVAGGVLYGEGEDRLRRLFRDAWCGRREHVVVGGGGNHIPSVHVKDLARLTRQVMDNPNVVASETPYFLAVDQPGHREGAEGGPEGEDAPVGDGEDGGDGDDAAEAALRVVSAAIAASSTPSTQEELVTAVVAELCEPYELPHADEWPPPGEGEADEGEDVAGLQEAALLDLRLVPSAHMLDPEFAAVSEPPGWHCRTGLVRNVRRIADEFCKERKLRAMRVLVGGPPASGKTTLCKAIAEHFRVPHLELPESGGHEDMVATLSSRVCRYRGYVLDAGGAGFTEVERLFRFDIEVPREDGEEDEEPAAGEEGEEGEEGAATAPPPRQTARQLHEDICPSFAIVLQAPRGLCEGRFNQVDAGRRGSFLDLMTEYSGANLDDGVHSLSDFFQEIARSSVLNLPVAGRDEEEMFESARIYMEREGRPFNYLPAEAEVAAGVLRRRHELEEQGRKASADDAVLGEQEAAAAAESERQRHRERAGFIADHEEQHRKLMALPLREYLMEYMVPTLTEGLIEVCKVLPDNPVDYLAGYLEKHAAEGTSSPCGGAAAGG